MKTMQPISRQGDAVHLYSPTILPKASGFLWNAKMMIQMNCRGYAQAQFMQPEPAKYVHAPTIEAQTFMQPEQPFYAHHPGRFFYIKDHSNRKLFSVPYEPTRKTLDAFDFIVKPESLEWHIRSQQLRIKLVLHLAAEHAAELWSINIENLSDSPRTISVYPYFPFGYMSWMNQSADYHKDLQGVICHSIKPYQKFEDYFKNKNNKVLSYLICDKPASAWETRQEVFEGEGGLSSPSALQNEHLGNGRADYEMPTACMQYVLSLEANKEPQKCTNQKLKFAFGPAKHLEEINDIRKLFFVAPNAFKHARDATRKYVQQGQCYLNISTPDQSFDNFVNSWLPRQVLYHGDVNRLSTDPQTRNYLQDAMGLAYFKPVKARAAFLKALSQQHSSGQMPDGILLTPTAELKYINQIPHTDHCVWLPITLRTYLDETNDLDILSEQLGFADQKSTQSVFEHICLAMNYLLKKRDSRGLHYIQQGDWCDPMNMVGYKGKGVSGWLTMATSYALTEWAKICDQGGHNQAAEQFRQSSENCNRAVNQHLWDGNWYARGITDDGNLFGTSEDKEGRIFLNSQSWAMLCGAADTDKQNTIIQEVEAQLETPYGVAMLAPAYTSMREDIGRVTQKFPGSAENGSVYNHAAAFYIYALYEAKQPDRAYKLLKQMIPGSDRDDLLQRGQLPVFIPNYYRGAYYQYPRTAGRSSQLFNTGTVHWFYRCLVDGLFGVRGHPQGLLINPQLPSHWPSAQLKRTFRGAQFNIQITRSPRQKSTSLNVNGVPIKGLVIRNIDCTENHTVLVTIPS